MLHAIYQNIPTLRPHANRSGGVVVVVVVVVVGVSQPPMRYIPQHSTEFQTQSTFRFVILQNWVTER